MSEDIELKLLNKIEELEKEIKELKGEELETTPIYSFSKIKFSDLKKLVFIKRQINTGNIFDEWFSFAIQIEESDLLFLSTLLEKEKNYLTLYKEENLKVKFITPILNRIDFNINQEIRDFYNEKLTYKSEKFIFNGDVDFVLAKGLEESEKPYFFIQEFKKGKENSDPEPQLLAELIAGVELNSWQSIKGAYIVGSIWNFVILERLEKHKYIYYVSPNFDSSKIYDLQAIYKNLLFIKSKLIDLAKLL